MPDYCFLKMNESLTAEGKDISESEDSSLIKINCWIGPMGTVSPLHFDPDHNLLAQVCSKSTPNAPLMRHNQNHYCY